MRGAPDSSSDDTVSAGPLVTVTSKVVITVPTSASAAKSVSISVNAGVPVVANVSSGSPGCSGTNPVVCTKLVSAPTSSDLFALKTFNGANGTGSVLASGSLLQTITVSSVTVKVTLAGTPHSITLALKTTAPRECNPSTNIPLYAMVADSSGNNIIGAYGATITLKDSDTSGKTSLSPSSTSNSSTTLTLVYGGRPLQMAAISGSAAGVASVTDAVLKPLQMIYVTNYSAPITVFPSNATGNVKPARTITNAGFSNFMDVALDGSCNLDVLNANTNSILVFSAGTNGNVAAKRTITGSNTLLNFPSGIAVDGTGNMYVANTDGHEILEFAASANGNVAPVKNISGSNTLLSSLAPVSIALGPTNKIYVAAGSAVLVFASGANGNVAPSANITDGTTPFSSTKGVSVDSSGKIYATDYFNNNVSIFAANANGSSTPVQVISGSNTKLANPIGLSLDYAGDIEATDFGGQAQLVFTKTSNGNVPPKANISGSNTGLSSPQGSAI